MKREHLKNKAQPDMNGSKPAPSEKDFFSPDQKSFLETIRLGVKESPLSNFHFLKKPLCLVFKKGFQKGLAWNIEYVPRTFGSKDCDLPIIDPEAPAESFKLIFKEGKIFFSTQHKTQVFFNHKSQNQALVQAGDVIIVGSAYIQIEMK